MYRCGEWKENKAHSKQRHRTSLLARQGIVMLLGFSCTQVHLGKAASTTAKNHLFLSALVVITSIITLQFAQKKIKNFFLCFN